MIEYEAQEVWFGRIYKGKTIGSEKERNEKRKNIVTISNDRLADIEVAVKGKFEPHMILNKRVCKVVDAGTHIVFPPLYFEKTFNPSPIDFECKIRINPCPEREEHYSKIWTVIGSNSKQSSKKIRKFFNGYVTQPGEDTEEIIKEIIVRAEGDLSPEEIKYPITIKNIGSKKIDSNHPVFRLFETDDVSEAKTILRNEDVRTITKDLLYLLGENDIEELTFERMQAMDIHWDQMKCFDSSGEHRFVYGIKAEDHTCQVAGFTNLSEHKSMHDFFQPTVLEFIYAL